MAEHATTVAFPDDNDPADPFPAGERVSRVMCALLPAQNTTVGVRVSWSPGDPFAVTARFLLGRDPAGDVVWVLGRDLLAQGLWYPAGTGDVRVWPAGWAVVLRLDSPTGRAEIVFDADELTDFLTATDTVFASAQRAWRAGMDTAITGLLDGSAP
jgi:Streptomyces sporulation and cell division protein, SsgA